MKRLYLFALASAIACASGGAGTGSAPNGDRNIITEQEIQSVPSSSLYDLIEKLRPQFLRSRGATSITTAGVSEYAVVYVDGHPYGDLGSLRSIVANQVSGVHYFDAMSAAQRFGTINGSGVIEVTIKR